MKRNGFTLVELMIVVAILGILAAIAVPMYSGYIRSSKKSEAKANLETIRLLEETYFADRKLYVAGADTAALKTNLPGFEPGNVADLYYTYKVEAGSTGAIATSFVATATLKTNSAKLLTINEKNEKTGDW